jgi:hypothetical protein
MEACRLMLDVAGDIVGAGSSSPKVTPKARSLASLSSFTYASHSGCRKYQYDATNGRNECL